MAKFRVKVTRVSRVVEDGYTEVEAKNEAEAIQKAREADDPDDMRLFHRDTVECTYEIKRGG